MAEEIKNNQTPARTPTKEERRAAEKDKDWRVSIRWFGNHILAELLSIILIMAFLSLTKNSLIQGVLMVLAFLCYFMLLGMPAWQLGHQDRNKVKFGRKKTDYLRGFRVGLLASLPLWLFGVALLFAKAELLPNFYPVYKILNCHALIFMNLIDRTFFGAESAYLTVDSWASVIGVFLLNLLPALICGLHYILGFKDVVIMDNLIYKKKKTTK